MKGRKKYAREASCHWIDDIMVKNAGELTDDRGGLVNQMDSRLSSNVRHHFGNNPTPPGGLYHIFSGVRFLLEDLPRKSRNEGRNEK